jgi:hypothetical protein
VGRRFQTLPDAHEQQYALLLGILRSTELGTGRELRAGYNPEARFSGNEYYRANMVCFSDIPVPDLGIHMKKFSRFGLSFRKSYLIEHGANPVFYVARNSQAKLAHGQMMQRAEYFDGHHEKVWDFFRRFEEECAFEDGGGGLDPHEIRRILGFLVYHFFSFVKFYDEGLPADHEENYYMEREWRIFGNLEFSLDQVRRVIFPQEFARRFRDDLPEYFGEITFS